jgi:hypothetical protein
MQNDMRLRAFLRRLPNEYDPGMSIILPALAVGYTAFCVWLTVGIINRRERWAKWTLIAVLVAAVVGYPLSIGPVLALHARGFFSYQTVEALVKFYGPLQWVYENGPDSIRDAIVWYANLWNS